MNKSKINPMPRYFVDRIVPMVVPHTTASWHS